MTPEEMRRDAQMVADIVGGCPVGWMRDRLPSDAISAAIELPPRDKEVLAWVCDPEVCIWYYPVIARRDAYTIWTGLPGIWISLPDKRWTLTHWKPLSGNAA